MTQVTAPSSTPAMQGVGEGGMLGLTPPYAAALAWAAGWFSGLVVLWLDPSDRFVRQHALQAAISLGGLTVLAIGSWGLGLLMAFVTPVLFRALTWLSAVAWAALLLVWLAGIVQALRGKRLRLPLVSGWGERLTSRHSTPPVPPIPL